MALTYSQKLFLQSVFPDREVVLFPLQDTFTKLRALKRACTREDVITTIGGGNMDDIYVDIEDCRRFVIQKFPKNKIISFPQTIAFSDTPFGQKRLKKTVRTCAKHKNLTLFAREVSSLEKMRMCFPNNKICFSPDIVLSLNQAEPKEERTTVISCLRDDKENFLTGGERALLLAVLEEKYPGMIHTDTVNISLEECRPDSYEQTLHRFWDMLKGAKVVVTDRLHGMIFCAITQTPCVVLNNSNNKIKGVYEAWLAGVPYIKFIDGFDVDAILHQMEVLAALDLSQAKTLDLVPAFEDMRKTVTEGS
ncbi:MAG: polysaccharide pyruvyl transferase family protein [Clostridiales bacterium]|nr:polysaccharide pyruvyl transferase family protein [Clostridiales bacterium]